MRPCARTDGAMADISVCGPSIPRRMPRALRAAARYHTLYACNHRSGTSRPSRRDAPVDPPGSGDGRHHRVVGCGVPWRQIQYCERRGHCRTARDGAPGDGALATNSVSRPVFWKACVARAADIGWAGRGAISNSRRSSPWRSPRMRRKRRTARRDDCRKRSWISFGGELDEALQARLGALTLDDLMRRAAAAGLRRPTSEPITFAI